LVDCLADCFITWQQPKALPLPSAVAVDAAAAFAAALDAQLGALSDARRACTTA
jgi:hypothetical protein